MQQSQMLKGVNKNLRRQGFLLRRIPITVLRMNSLEHLECQRDGVREPVECTEFNNLFH